MKKIIFLFSVIVAAYATHAQQSMTLYNMQAIPQRNSLNPALQYDGTGMVGFPMLSSVYFNLSNSAFKITDFVRRSDDDSLYLDGDNMIGKMKDEHNFISTSLQADIFSFGFKVKKSYFAFGVTEKINSQFDYPKEMMEFIWKGNAATLGKESVLQFGFNFMHYREYSLTYSIVLSNKLSLGTKLKYLYGMENASSNNSRISLYTDPYSFAITAKSNININTSGLEDNSFDNFSMSEYAFGRKNTGYALDLGAGYKFSEKIFLSASVLDLGKIKWNSHVVNYKSNTENGEFTYYGIDLDQFVSGTSANDVWQNLADTLTTTFQVNPSHDSYQTKLPTQFYIGSNYMINQKNSFGILMHGEKFDKKMHGDYTLSYNKSVGKWLNVAGSWSVINQSAANFGLGLALKLGSEQIYFASDNVYGVFYPARSKNTNFRAGINFVFSKKAKPVKQQENEPAIENLNTKTTEVK
ncbi:MAG TPA: DUF5723 family protein [Bacteroidia bacterium]|nr:DUF5723 family protein [Bacteroidia bacterium]